MRREGGREGASEKSYLGIGLVVAYFVNRTFFPFPFHFHPVPRKKEPRTD